MTHPRRHDLEYDILTLFNRACSRGRFDVAEHLLRALETCSQTDGPEGGTCGAVEDAYRTIARIPPHRRHS